MNLLEYKDYYGSVEYSEEDDILFGEVLGLNDTFISYEGSSLPELKSDFHAGIDHYLETCKAKREQPESTNLNKVNSDLKSIVTKALV